MQQRPQRWLIYLFLILLVVSCGEPVPVDCTPDEEQCTTETEGGFETGTVAGIAAGGAAIVAIAAGGLGGGEDGGSSSSSQSEANNTNQNTPTLTGTLLDSAVGGVSYNTSSNLYGLTNTNGQFEYRSGDQVTFSIGDTMLGEVKGGALITPVELAGTNNTADRRVINISRLLQSLDQDGDPTNGISISPATRSMLAQQAFKFDIPVTEFQLQVNPFIENILNRPIIPADEAINHLHSSLSFEGRPGSIGSQNDIRLLVPGFVAVTPTNEPSEPPTTSTQLNCNFAGGTVPDGGSVIAYQSPNVAAGQLCSSQTRFCNKGLLSGSYAYISCQVQEATDCQFNGNSIANGTSVTTYQSSTVPFGQSCQSELRLCINGALGGTYLFQTCSEAGPTSCDFNGSEVPHGGVVTAFLAESVSSGSTCSSQVRSCFNGVLSGTYANSSCTVKQAQSCSFNSQTINDRQSVTAYLSNSVPFGSSCISETRSCDNGFLSGSHAFGSCSVAEAASCSFNGQAVQSGSSVTAYQAASVSYGNSCVSENRTCSNGTLNGSYAFGNCSSGGSATGASWVGTKQLGTTGDDYVSGITSDSSGNIYLTGFTEGPIDGNTSAGGYDVFVTKYDNTGVKKWTRLVGSEVYDHPANIVSDLSNNLYIVGRTSGNFDGNTNNEGSDAFLVKYNSIGEKQWSRQLGSTKIFQVPNDYGTGVTVDQSGFVYITGYTYGVFHDKPNQVRSPECFFAKYSNEGALIWVKHCLQYPSSTGDGNDIIIDGTGDLYVYVNRGNNLILLKHDSDGVLKWSRKLGTTSQEQGSRIATDTSGNIFLTGFTQGSLGNSQAGGRLRGDIFTTKYDSSGNILWVKQLGSFDDESGGDISTDSQGNIYVVGDTEGGLAGNYNASANRSIKDIFVVKYQNDGTLEWARQIGTFEIDSGANITIDQFDNVYVVLQSNGDFDGKTNLGMNDVFIIKYDSNGNQQ